MRKSIYKFSVSLSVPEKLQPLIEIAWNLWWAWNPRASRLFEQAAPELWESSRHNPVQMLGYMTLEQFDKLAKDKKFVAELKEITQELRDYMGRKTWCEQAHVEARDMKVAYFSAEFGLHECLPIYSGGLGVLAGDHMKSASDLGLPLVGVGLFYRHGYFSQYLNADGWQMESYPTNDFYNMPARPVLDDNGGPLQVSVKFPGREVWIQVWKVQVGRVPLYLLDTDVDRNSQHDRAITSHLYGGGLETRIEQEMVLGIGGMRALRAMGIDPRVCHMNEGHSAFLALERVRTLVKEKGLPFPVACEAVRQANVFTTHTPVPAGIDKFPPDMMRTYFGEFAPELGTTIDNLIDIGRENVHDAAAPFNMAVMALRLSAFANGVSKLHAEVSRKMWHGMFPDIPVDEVPIRHVTNGIHTQTWFSTEIADLYQKYMGKGWLDNPMDQEVWQKVDEIPDKELWGVHLALKQRLVGYCRKRLRDQITARGSNPHELAHIDEVLDPNVLTIGFSRRFATYKRATLLFRDLDRLKAIVNNPDRPVQFVFAGKAHPKDNQGKEFIREIVQVARRPEFRRHFVFIQDYDMSVARQLVQAVDVWLNNPRRPMEASGTSGMKVVVSGGLNCSILDGWWCEGYNGKNGWAIGAGEEYEDTNYQDTVESQALYDILSRSLIPLYYDRGADGVPHGWVSRMKEAIRTLCPVYNTSRMVDEYMEEFYLPSFLQGRLLVDNNYAEAHSLHHWTERVREAWGGVSVLGVEADVDGGMKIGDKMPVRATVNLGRLNPEDVTVEVYHGRIDEKGNLTQPAVDTIPLKKRGENGTAQFAGTIECRTTGQRGFMVRVLPSRKGLPHKFYTGLVRWWEGW